MSDQNADRPWKIIGRRDGGKGAGVVGGRDLSGLESRLTDEALHGNQPLRNGINCEEQALQGHCSKKRRAAGGNKARCCHLLAIQPQAHLTDRPHFPLTPCDHNALGSKWSDFESFRQRTWDDQQGSAGVHQQLDHLAPSRRSGQPSRNSKLVLAAWERVDPMGKKLQANGRAGPEDTALHGVIRHQNRPQLRFHGVIR